MKRNFIFLCIIVLATVLAYSNSFKNALLWDDTYTIVQNYFIRDLRNVKLLFTEKYFEKSEIGHYTRSGELSWRPAVTFSHMIEYRVFGMNPLGFHAVSIFIHAVTAALVFWYLMEWGISGIYACAGALVFALHPLHAETVNVVSYREDMLALFFSVLALLFFHRYEDRVNGHMRFLLLIPAFLSTALALLSKENTIVLPVLIFIQSYLLHGKKLFKDRKILRNQIFIAVILAIIMLIFICVALFHFPNPTAQGQGTRAGVSLFKRVAGVFTIGFHYLRQWFYPSGLKLEYNFTFSDSIFDIKPLLCFALLTTIFILMLRILKNREWLFFLLWLPVNLFPISNLIPLINPVADRYFYMPSFAFAGLVAAALQKSGASDDSRSFRQLFKSKRTVIPLIMVLCVSAGLGVFTHRRNSIWASPASFFTELALNTPDNPKAYNGLGMDALSTGNTQKAVGCFRKAVSLDPASPVTRNNLATALLKTRDSDGAKQEFMEVLKLDPHFIEAWHNLGLIYSGKGDVVNAESCFKNALKDNPGFVPSLFMLGNIYFKRHEDEKAEDLFLKIVKVNSDHAGATKNLGIIYGYRIPDHTKATYYLQRYLKLNPDDPQKELIEQEIKKFKTDARAVLNNGIGSNGLGPLINSVSSANKNGD